MDELTKKAQQLFEADHFATGLCGAEIMSVGDHSACCRMELGAMHRNARGVAMGGALFTLADMAAAVAANTEYVRGREELCWVSLDGSIRYLAPAFGASVVAECNAVKVGKSTSLYRTIITDEATGKLIATAETTMMKVPV